MLKSVADVLALLSAAVFSIPAWYGNRSGHLLVKMDLKNLRLGEPEFQSQYDGLVKDLQQQRDGWKPWKAWCFWIGTLTAIVAAALVIYSGLNEHAPLSVHT